MWSGGQSVRLVTLRLQGNKNTFVNIEKSFMYDGLLKPNPDLSVTGGVIEGAYTTPALVQ